MFHFIGENVWLTVASLASMQFPKDTGFDKGKYYFKSVMAFLDNLLVTWQPVSYNHDLVILWRNVANCLSLEYF